MDRVTIFVYGTLMHGFDAHDMFLSRAEFIGTATAKGDLYHLPFGYPVLVASGSGTVRGECYRVSSDDLAALREYEGLGDTVCFYEERVMTVACDGVEMEALVYVANPPKVSALKMTGTHVPAGDWRHFMASRRESSRLAGIIQTAAASLVLSFA